MSMELRHVYIGWDHPRTKTDILIPIEKADMPCPPPNAEPAVQLYENTTEGTPVSPVFPSKAALADWLFEHQTQFYYENQSRAQIKGRIEMYDLDTRRQIAKTPQWEKCYGRNNFQPQRIPFNRTLNFKNIASHLGKPLTPELWTDLVLNLEVNNIQIFKANEPIQLIHIEGATIILTQEGLVDNILIEY
jgi:hypothetical protein